MKCSRWQRLVALAVSDDLGSADIRKLEHHLQGCPGCRQLEHDLRHDLEALREMDNWVAEATALQSVRGAVLSQIDERRPGRRVFVTPVMAAAAAVVVVVGVLALFLGSGVGGPEPRLVDSAITPPQAAEETHVDGHESRAPVIETGPDSTDQDGTQAGPEPVIRTARAQSPESLETMPSPRSAAVEPMTMKILTDDPTVVIYWIVEAKGEKTNA